MHWIEKIATKCVILSQKKKKFFFHLGFTKSKPIYETTQNWRFKMKKSLATIFVLTLTASGVYASGCSEMAAFNTKINKALKTASFNQKTLADVRSLQSECKRQHDMGMSVNSINSCKKALDLVAIN